MRRKKNGDDQGESIKPDEIHMPAPTSLVPVRMGPDGQTPLELPLDGPLPDEETGEIELQGAERVRRAVLLRLGGATYDQIARTLNYSGPEQAKQAIHRSMAAVKMEAARELKRVQHMRLEHILMQLWPGMNGGDRQDMLIALQVMDRLERLHGLNYVPTEAEERRDDSVLIVGGDKGDFMQALDQARSRQRGVRGPV